MPKLILLSGLPASGKSTLGIQLSNTLQVPFLQKDIYKELLADVSKECSFEHSVLYGKMAQAIVYTTAQSILRAGGDVILEGMFYEERDGKKIREIEETMGCSIFQIQLTANPEVLKERFQKRLQTGQRHAIHLEHWLDRSQFDQEFDKTHLPFIEVTTFHGIIVDHTQSSQDLVNQIVDFVSQ